jgi:hypothetical protein
MPGSLPFASSIFISPPSPITVPIVSKKSDSITESTTASAVAVPSTEKKSNEKAPTRPKSGVSTTPSGIAAIPFPQIDRSFASFTMTASTVETTIPISKAPLTRRATSAALRASPTTNTPIGHVVSSPASESGVAPVFVTTPAFTRPISAMKAPMPMPIARFRSIGMAFRIASRTPVSTSTVIRRPSTTMTPMACGNDSPFAATSEKATKALSPNPAASANG